MGSRTGEGAYAISIFLSVLAALTGRVNTAGSLEAPRVTFSDGLACTIYAHDLSPARNIVSLPQGGQIRRP